MIWVGIALLVMQITGDGDDTQAFIALHRTLNILVANIIEDPARKKHALDELTAAQDFFVKRRKALKLVGECIEKADRSYTATRADYEACGGNREQRWREFEQSYGEFRTEFRKAFTDAEWQTLERELGRQMRDAQ